MGLRIRLQSIQRLNTWRRWLHTWWMDPLEWRRNTCGKTSVRKTSGRNTNGTTSWRKTGGRNTSGKTSGGKTSVRFVRNPLASQAPSRRRVRMRCHRSHRCSGSLRFSRPVQQSSSDLLRDVRVSSVSRPWAIHCRHVESSSASNSVLVRSCCDLASACTNEFGSHWPSSAFPFFHIGHHLFPQVLYSLIFDFVATFDTNVQQEKK